MLCGAISLDKWTDLDNSKLLVRLHVFNKAKLLPTVIIKYFYSLCAQDVQNSCQNNFKKSKSIAMC